jgi:PAS domain S-box-containing protein
VLGSLLLLYLSWQLFHWLPGRQQLGQLFLPLFDLIGMWAAWQASRRCAPSPGLRRFWRLMSAVLAAELIADLILSGYDIAYVRAPFPTPADAFFLASYALLLAALVSVPVARMTRARRLRMSLDGWTIVLGGATVVWYFVLGPTALASGESLLAKGVSMAYPLGDLVLLGGVAVVLMRQSSTALRVPLLVIACGVLLAVAADIVYGYGVLHDTYTAGDPADILYVLEYSAFALAALAQGPVQAQDPATRTQDPDTRTQDPAVRTQDSATRTQDPAVRAQDSATADAQEPEPMQRYRAAAWLPYVSLAVGFGMLLGVSLGHAFFPDFSLVLIVVALATLVATRQYLAQRELGRVQAELGESERRFRAIFENAAVGITYTDLDGPRILDANSTFARMVGYTQEELRGGDYSRIAQGDFKGADRALAEAVRSGQVDQLQQELGYVSADGSARCAMLSVSTLRDEQGRPSHVVGIFEDITRRRDAERAKEEFVSIVGHELRSPLTSIRGSLGLLEAGVVGELPEEASNMVALAIANTDRLVRLVNDILDIERMDSGHLPLERAPVAVTELARNAVQALQDTAVQAGVRLLTDAAELEVCADADRIVQTLVNLLGNAIKFSPREGAVTVAVSRRDGCALFSVKDSGRGIPPDQLDSIFERFNQVDASDAREKGGSGLGLAIARGIVVSHGGHLWAESVPGQGSTFSFTLPLAGADAPCSAGVPTLEELSAGLAAAACAETEQSETAQPATPEPVEAVNRVEALR